MANYSNLKTAIENAVDWNNGDNEITGQNLLDILETIIDSLGAKYKFADVATPASSITTPDEPLFYLAGAGTYTNFSGLSVTIPRGTLAIFYYDTAWHYTTVRTDSDAFFNVNQYLGTPSTTYTKANGRNAVPSALRSKGMIITYLTTDGWIIEQNLSTSGTWNADANWQTIGPVSVSQNTLIIGDEEKCAVPNEWENENPEYIEVKVDSKGKILEAIKKDGTKVINGETLINGNLIINSDGEKSGKSILEVSTIIIDGSSLEAVEDKESRKELLTDSQEKIVSYRDKKGILHENIGLDFGETAMDEFHKVLKRGGIATDWSDYISENGAKPLILPEPVCAYVNITDCIFPTTKTDNYCAYLEYHDNYGNYFKKKIILNAQGSSSIIFNNQKNLSIDLFDSDWNGDAFSIKFGNWVPQDSFHIKTFYQDPIRGLADVCYKFGELVIQKTNTRPNRLARNSEDVTINSDTGIISNDFDTGALCHPDGFPCLIFDKGKFMGIYAWNLKKNRANYMMDKKDYESIIIDPSYCNLWNLQPINWQGIEIRNPKKLICMDGTTYDGDEPKELIDSSSAYWDGSTDQTNTVLTKNIIIGLHNSIAAINSAATTEEKKALFDATFDVDGFIAFWLVSQLLDNWDGLRDRNTQWLYYKKSGKWCPSFYDLDNCLGYCGTPYLKEPLNSLTQRLFDEVTYNENLANGWLWEFHKTEIVEMYNNLRNASIIHPDTFIKIYDDWYKRIGTEYISANAKKWDVPCYRDGKINTEYWKEIGIVLGTTETYSPEELYNVGDVVTYGVGNYIVGDYVVQFECVQSCIGQTPCGIYPNKPETGGTFDSPRRIKKWLEQKIEFLDNIIVE